MSTQSVIFWLSLIILILVAGAVYLAVVGSVWAIAILFTLWSVLCICLGAGIVLLVNAQHGKQEEARFQANMKENLATVQAIQRIQNDQAKGLVHQVGQLSRIPQPGNGSQMPPAFLIDDGIFDELEG